jgi:hypothetical protein
LKGYNEKEINDQLMSYVLDVNLRKITEEDKKIIFSQEFNQIGD